METTVTEQACWFGREADYLPRFWWTRLARVVASLKPWTRVDWAPARTVVPHHLTSAMEITSSMAGIRKTWTRQQQSDSANLWEWPSRRPTTKYYTVNNMSFWAIGHCKEYARRRGPKPSETCFQLRSRLTAKIPTAVRLLRMQTHREPRRMSVGLLWLLVREQLEGRRRRRFWSWERVLASVAWRRRCT